MKSLRENRQFALSFLSIFLFTFSCVDREHANIFDPNAGFDSLNVEPKISRSDSIIEIFWPHSADQKEIQAYNIYRRVGTESQFTKINTVSNNVFAYSDTAVAFDVPHRYYLTYTGIDTESPPTRSVKTTPGLSSFWILDDLDLTVRYFTHDMSFNPANFYTVWYPESFACDSKRNRGLITFTAIDYFEIFDLQSTELLMSSSEINSPYDCIYLQDQDVYWVSDSGKGIYEVDPADGTENFLSSTNGNPTKMQYHSAGWVYALERKNHSIKKYDLTGQLVNEYNEAGNNRLMKPVNFHVVESSQDIYIIDRNPTESFLIRLQSQALTADTLLIAETMQKVITDINGEMIWVSINTAKESYILQLSNTGLRLKQLDGFKHIADFKINPYNDALVICDYYGNKVVQIRQDGSKIAETKKRLIPHKVYIK